MLLVMSEGRSLKITSTKCTSLLKLKASFLLVSEKINGHKFIEDKLSVNLDRTSHRIIKNWEHLACTDEINAPPKVRLQCKTVGDNCCTMMLFEVLTSEFEDKTVKDLIDALSRIKRNDVKKIITDAHPSMFTYLFFIIFSNVILFSQMLI